MLLFVAASEADVAAIKLTLTPVPARLAAEHAQWWGFNIFSSYLSRGWDPLGPYCAVLNAKSIIQRKTPLPQLRWLFGSAQIT